MDDARYNDTLKRNLEAHEALCTRCGECCGAYGADPCAELAREPDGRYRCVVYADRLGPRRTRSGVIFTCVTMRDVHRNGVFYRNCAYSHKDNEWED